MNHRLVYVGKVFKSELKVHSKNGVIKQCSTEMHIMNHCMVLIMCTNSVHSS